VPCYRAGMTEVPDSAARPRPIVEMPALAARAAEMLRMPETLLPLNAEEAAQVVARMVTIGFRAGATVLREGDGRRSDYMLLLLEGEVQVDTRAGLERDAMAIAVDGPGSIIGEMSLLDGAPRSATCTAMGAVLAAGLSRKGLEALIAEQPRTAAKLMMGVAQRIADRLRALGQQLHMMAEITGVPPRRGPLA
jgi:CRP/FNR family transcriptional regulator, cyclic AMP receptor protein